MGMEKNKARDLRKNQTDAEQRIWNHLRLRQMGAINFEDNSQLENILSTLFVLKND